jgi:hypothetical protein
MANAAAATGIGAVERMEERAAGADGWAELIQRRLRHERLGTSEFVART